MKTLDIVGIRKLLAQIKIAKRNSIEGEVQRTAFKLRYGVKPEEV